MGKMLDGNTAALRKHEATEDRLERVQTALEERARPVFEHIMANLDSDVLDAAFQQITKDDYRHLIEDLGSGPMHDLTHGGLIVSDIIKRHVWKLAVEEVDY